MTVRVPLDRLPADVAAALVRGDTVEFEDEGRVTAIARPEVRGSNHTLWEALSRLKPLDTGFEADVCALDDVARAQESAWEH